MRLTAKEFGKAMRNRTNLSDRVINMARAILVDGMPCTAVGKKYGVSRQSAHRAAQRIFLVHTYVMGCPKGWQIVQLKLPTALVRIVRQLEQEAVAHYHQNSKE